MSLSFLKKIWVKNTNTNTNADNNTNADKANNTQMQDPNVVILMTMNHTALSLIKEGKMADAEEIYRQSIDILKVVLQQNKASSDDQIGLDIDKF